MPLSTGVVQPIILVTDKDTHFTGAIAQHAREDETITIPEPAHAGFTKDYRITQITIESDQNLDWSLYFFRDGTFSDADLDDDAFQALEEFALGEGLQIAGAGQYYYNHSSLNLRIRTTSTTAVAALNKPDAQTLNISLVNRAAAAKNAGATGEIVIKVWLEPIMGN